MDKDSGGGTPNPNQTQTVLTDPAKLPYYTKLWDEAMQLHSANKNPTPNPFSAGDMSIFGGGPSFQWKPTFGLSNPTYKPEGVTLNSTGPIDWSKYFGTGVKNPNSAAAIAENPALAYQYQGLPGTKTAEGTALNPTPAPGTAPVLKAPTTIEEFYRNELGRAPEAAGLANWQQRFGTGPLTPTQLAEMEAASASSGELANSPASKAAHDMFLAQQKAGFTPAKAPLIGPNGGLPAPQTAAEIAAASKPITGTALFNPAVLAAAQQSLNTNTDGGAKAGGYVNPFAVGGSVKHFAEGGTKLNDAMPDPIETDYAPPAPQGLDEASARSVFKGINTGVDPSSQQYTDAIKWATSTPGMTADKIREIALQNGQTLKGTNAEKSTITADKLSNSQAPAEVTSSYKPTDYNAQQVHGDSFKANKMAAPRDVNSPEYKQYQMTQAANIAAQQNTANQMTKPTDATNASMTQAGDVTTDKFIDPGNVESYMNPYQKAATDVAVREARRTSDIQQNKADASAQQAGAFGGYRQGIENAESQRNEAQLESDITTKGRDAAYQQAMAQYSTDAARKLAAQQSNQAAETTMKVQNLSADQQTRLANLGMAVQVGQANLSAAQQTALANQATDLAAQQSNQNTATQTGIANLNSNLTTQQQGNASNMQAQMANQAADLGVGQSNLGAAQQTAIANQGNSMQGQIANQGASLQGSQQNQQARQTANAQGIQAQLANIDNYYRNQGVQLTGAQLNAQLAQQQQQAAMQKYGYDINADVQTNAQNLNAQQFATTTATNIMAGLAKQYGEVANWPQDQLAKLIAMLKT